MTRTTFDARLDLIPAEPGVYLMKDAAGSVIYVGKAKILPNRLRSYFCKEPQGNKKVLAMIAQIADFSYITCENELEALILENNLIKQYRPHYNILLRDDKEYPYIKVTLHEQYPRVMKVFHVDEDQKKGAVFYGPYLAGDLNLALQALHKIFPIKTCKRVFPRDIGKDRPCLNYYIGRCIGPCLGEVSEAEYRSLIQDICRFLEGNYRGLLTQIESEMKLAADQLNFEAAAQWRDRLTALQHLMARQIIVSQSSESIDVIGLARNASEICLQKLEVREGRMLASSSIFVEDRGEHEGEVLDAYIRQIYREDSYIPSLVLLPTEPEDMDLIAGYLSLLADHKVELRRPQRGEKKQLLEMAEKNAEQNLRRHTLMGSSSRSLAETLQQLATLLDLDRTPNRIEAYDIANLAASDRSASMVVFEQGRPQRKSYRQFKLAEGEIDDYAAMQEVLARRLNRLGQENFGADPDLILLDGGLGHVNAVKAIRDSIAPDIPLAGMVKDDRHRTKGLVLEDGRLVNLQTAEGETADARAERLGLLRLVTAIQDEAHRFAGRLQKKLTHKRMVKYSLEEIEGVGPSRRKLLLKEFKTVKAISEGSLEELKAVPGLPIGVAENVYRHFHPEGGD